MNQAELRRLAGIVGGLRERQKSALRHYRPLPALAPFHASNAKWRLISGSNRSGKTLAGAVELARAVTGTDPYGKYKPRDGNALVVALDNDQIGMLWRKLTAPGAFIIVRDKSTGMWRGVRWREDAPNELDGEDAGRVGDWEDAPPLLESKMIKSISWEKSDREIPRTLVTRTGWRVLWRSSRGKPPQGEHYDYAWIDEAIANEQFYYEIARGIVDVGQQQYKSRAVWTATPQIINEQIWELQQAALRGDEDTEAFQALIDANPFISEEERKRFLESLPESERLARYYGEHIIGSWRVYPMFDPMGIHGAEPFEVPRKWTRYVYLDPGQACTATLIVAVDEIEEHVWVIDAFQIKRGDAQIWATELAKRLDYPAEQWIIDSQMGAAKHAGRREEVASIYRDAAMDRGLEPLRHGPLRGFVGGCRNTVARMEALRKWMHTREAGPHAGTPVLKVIRGRAPDLVKQIQAARVDPNRPDKRVEKNDDLLDCLEYAAAHQPRYVERDVDPVSLASERVWKEFLRNRYRHRKVQFVGPGIEVIDR